MEEHDEGDTIARQLKMIEALTLQFFGVLLCAILVYAAAAALYRLGLSADPSAPEISPLALLTLAPSVATLVLLAGAAVGGFLGFLFGIPRLLTNNGRIQSRVLAAGEDLQVT